MMEKQLERATTEQGKSAMTGTAKLVSRQPVIITVA
jgi:hypothetical protein